MTSGNVNNFVSDLVLMAKAMEELPAIKSELEATKSIAERYANTVQALELKLIDRANELDALQAAKRTVEAERDDAELRFLEADERTSKALEFIKTTFGSAGSVIQSLEPPAPVAVSTPPAEPEVIHQPGGQEDGVRTGEDVRPSPAPYTAEEALADPAKRHDMFLEAVYYEKADATTGQGAADPTASSMDNTSTSAPSTVESMASAFSEIVNKDPSASSPTSAPAAPTGTGMEQGASGSKPWAGMKWSDAQADSLNPPYNYTAWLGGGGTAEDFHR